MCIRDRDIGGGSLEIAYGLDEDPDVAVSLPLGAGRLTSADLPGDPPDPEAVRALRRRVRAEIARVVSEFTRYGTPDHVVGTSKTFKQLARIAGAARSAEGLYVQRELTRKKLEEWVPRLASMAAGDRAELPGVSEGRSRQLLAGALVAEAAMDLFGVCIRDRPRSARTVTSAASALASCPGHCRGPYAVPRDGASGAHSRCEGRAVDGLGVSGVDGDGLRDRRAPGLRRRRGDGVDRPRQPGHRGAAQAVGLPRGAGAGRARTVSADHPARVVHRPVGQAPAGP